MHPLRRFALATTLGPLLASGVLALDGVVSINELMYHPRTDGVEWIELHNMMSVDVDLSEWRISGGIDYEFPSGTVIPGGGYLVVEGTGRQGALGPFAGLLDNNGERIRLRNNSDRIMDQLDYGDTGRWPVAADGSGSTLAKRRPRLASALPENWTFSPEVGGTPGSSNFGSEELTVTLLKFDTTWRYNESGITPATGWEDTPHPVGTDAWEEGPGVLAAELNALPLPIGTNLTLPGLNDPFVITYYLETEFNLTAEQAENLKELNLTHLIDDGAIFYLNGEEVLRYGMDPGPVTPSTTASRGAEAVLVGPVSIPTGAAVPGSNRLSVEVHQTSNTSSDVVFGLELAAVISQSSGVPSLPLQVSEVSAADAPLFWVELLNTGSIPIEIEGVTLENPATTGGGSHSLAAGLLAPGERLVVDETSLGFRVADEGRLFLRFPDSATVLDAVRVKNRPLARQPGEANDARFFTASAPTPGAPNTFAFRDEIVINEIMYHHRPQPARDAQAAELVPFALSSWSDPWRYNQSGVDLGTNWAEAQHPVGGSWLSGDGLLGFDLGGSFPEPILTSLTWPALNAPYVITYYFEREVTLTQEQFDQLEEVRLAHLIDDGAVIYVNGVDAGRFCMPAGRIDANTLANCPAGNEATLQGPFIIPKTSFVPGQNRISVEVHQAEVGSSDVVFGAELTAMLVAAGGTPSQPYAEIDEEWIELHNRSAEAVDLTGWSLDGAISFPFPDHTTIGPGAYLVVARDAASLAAKHPTATILGDFSGRLANGSAYLKLEDPFQNPADEVFYHDGGRWPGAADGQGSSLELRDPHADNSLPEAWAASDESERSSWQHISYRTNAQRFPGTNDPTAYHEFIFGLLDSGEILLDDLSVIEEPDGAARELVQNGSFEGDAPGAVPAHWRMVGTHGLHGRTVVVADPDRGGNVLHVTATGPMWHQQNQAETTLKDGNQFVSIVSSREYEISFRAKWLTGCPLLNTRLYFDRVANTHVLDQPGQSGTPGAPNSTLVTNLGPTADHLRHSPLRPASGAPVTIAATVTDPDGISSVTLHWSTNGSTYTQTPMINAGGNRYEGLIPGHPPNTRVQFYLESEDSLGAIATFPIAGPRSRALYRVGSLSGGNAAQHLEIIMLPSDEATLASSTNLMSNHRFGATLVYEDEVFHDVGVRLKGSQRGRPDLSRRGFSIEFHADQKFRGVLETIGLDRSGGWRFGRTFGQDEILIWHFMNHAGGIPALHNDLVFLDAPGVANGSAQLQLARFSNDFLDGQFTNGNEGALHNFELIYWPTTTTGGAEGLKLPNPDNVNGVSIRSLGTNKEAYRYYFQLRNDQIRDDYRGIIDLAELFSMSTTNMLANASAVIDLDQWLRSYAAVSLAAVSDSYFNNTNNHNARFYRRPSDGRMLLFPWDMDFAFITGATSSMTPNSDLTRLLSDPVNRRTYWGHVQDLVNRSYNAAYMGRWVEHYEQFLTGQDLSPLTSFIQQRADYALAQVQSAVPAVPFSITTNGGSAFDSAVTPVVLEGNGWVNVREIRLAGSGAVLPVTWTDANSWQVSIPLGPGGNAISFEALDFAGQVIAADSIAVTNTSAVIAAAPDNFVLTELMYHPADPSPTELAAGFTDADDFEFCEFQNISSTTVDASDVAFDAGISFTIPPGTHVAPGQRFVLVRNPAAFQERYAAITPGITVIGSYGSSGTSFSNSGERIDVLAADGGTLTDFTYRDGAPWPLSSDGDGYSLVPIAPEHALFDPALPINWRSSSTPGGNPGGTDAYSFPDWSAAHGNVTALDDPEGDHLVAIVEYATGRTPAVTDRHPSITIDPADLGLVAFVLAVGADDVGVTAELSSDLLIWSELDATYAGTVNNGDGTRTLFFAQSALPPASFVRFRFSLR